MDLERQYDCIYRYCYMKTGHQETAEDLTQETFLRFLEGRGYREQGKELAYLYTIARNLCMDFFRRKQHLPLERVCQPGERNGSVAISGSGGLSDRNGRVQNLSGTGANPGVREDDLLSAMILGQALEHLDEEEREIIFLRYVNELSAAQIGTVLGISRFAAHRRLKRGLERLRQWIRKEDFQEIF